MSGVSPDRLAVRWPMGLLGMLALVLVVEASIVRLRDDLTHPLGESWRFAAKAAEANGPGADVLCFGDSLIKYGVLPREIETKTGLKAYNLATSGGTTPSAYFLLRRALGAGARPRAIVVDFAALLPVAGAPPKVLNYAELATTRDCLDLAWASNDPGFLGSTLTAKVLPSCQFRFEIRNAFRAAFEGRSDSERDSVRSHRLIWARQRGGQPAEPGRSHHLEESQLINGICPVDWTCPPMDQSYIDRFLDLADSRGIAVYWLLPPLSPGVRELRVARGSDMAYERFARSVAGRHPNTVVLDGRGAGYDDSVFIDHLHLDRLGARRLSGDVGSAIFDGLTARPGRASAAWVALPSPAGPSGDDPPPALAGRRSLGVSR